MMQTPINLDSQSPRDNYKLLSALVTPRPIAWIATYNPDKSINLAPFSFFNLMGCNPPIAAVSIGNRPSADTHKDTRLNIDREKRCTIHLTDASLLQPLAASAEGLAYGNSEADWLALDTATFPSHDCPLVKDAKVAIAASLHSTQTIGNNQLVFLSLHAVILHPDICENTKLMVNKWHPLGRMESPNGYSTSEKRVYMDSGKNALDS